MGLANQTTMLRNETMAIGKLLERTMMEKYGPAELKSHYMVMDTICDATQVPAHACIRQPGTACTWPHWLPPCPLQSQCSYVGRHFTAARPVFWVAALW